MTTEVTWADRAIAAGWRYLEITDRADGATSTLNLSSKDADKSVHQAAQSAGYTYSGAWSALIDGGTITTAAFYRRLGK